MRNAGVTLLGVLDSTAHSGPASGPAASSATVASPAPAAPAAPVGSPGSARPPSGGPETALSPAETPANGAAPPANGAAPPANGAVPVFKPAPAFEPALPRRTPVAGRGIVVDGVSVSLGGAPVLRRASISAAPGRTLAILGPSGCGKTTLLRVLSGLQRVSEGTVALGDRVVSGDGVHVAAESRGVGMVFQDWSLFPHLTVAANVAFGLRRSERPRGRLLRRPASARVQQLLRLVGVAELSDRLPGSLSGGQQQRVALARALAPRPSVLLLDEPFSSLDTTLRVDVRAEVASLLRELEVTCVFVTHDQDEAFVLGDEVAVMRDGEVIQQASPAALYELPASRWVAGFVGEAEILPGHAEGDTAHTVLGRLRLRAPASGAVDVMVRPEDILVGHGGPGPGAAGVVHHVEFFGHDTLYYVRRTDGSVLRCRATGAPEFTLGAPVRLRHSGARTVAFAD